MPKPQLHWSHLNMLLRCGAQYAFRYIDGLKRPPAVAMLIGSATHKGVEHNMLAKRDGIECRAEDVSEVTAEEVESRWRADGVALDQEEKSQGEASVRGEAKDSAVALALLHYRELAPSITPVHVERKWVIATPDTMTMDLSGTIDLQEANILHDTKTAKRSPPAGAADGSDQLTLYAIACLKLDGRIPELQIDSLVKTKTPKAVIQKTVRTEDDMNVFLRRVAVVQRSIQSGIFLPAPADSWICSEKFCGFTGVCTYFRKRVAVSTAE